MYYKIANPNPRTVMDDTTSRHQNPPNYIFLGMWHNYRDHDDLKTLLLPPGIPNWRDIDINYFIRTRGKPRVDMLICGPFKCDKNLAILTRYRKQLAHIPKLLMNGENPTTHSRRNYLQHCIKVVDYVIDFRRYNTKNNPGWPANLTSIQFPVWLWNELKNGVRWQPGDNPVVRLNKGWQRKTDIKYLATCVAGHDTNNTRLPIIRELQKHGQVACPGKLISNCPPIPHGYPAKIEFIAQSRFNICSENSAGPGYFTEKIFNALEAGCKPIYWCGSQQRPIWVNPAAYIYLPDLAPQTIIDIITPELSAPRPQELPGLAETPLTPTAEWEIADCYYQLEFLFYNPAILKLPQPEVIQLTGPDHVLTELAIAQLGTQIIWGPQTTDNTNNPTEWQYLNWMGISIPSTTLTGLEPLSEIIKIITASPSGIIHKNYFTTQLVNQISYLCQ